MVFGDKERMEAKEVTVAEVVTDEVGSSLIIISTAADVGGRLVVAFSVSVQPLIKS